MKLKELIEVVIEVIKYINYDSKYHERCKIK